MLFFEPGNRYVAISVTGYACELLCDYCRGRWLRGMLPAPTPGALAKLLAKLAKSGVTGILVSGGFNREGYLPVERFIPVLERFRKEHPDVIISMHAGLMPLETLEKLTSIVDIIDFEIPLTRAQRLQMHLTASLREYLLLAARADALGFRVVPHLLLGLPGSALAEEEAAAQYVALILKPRVLVLLYHVESLHSPRCIIERLRRVASAVKPYVGDLSLGCMRPRTIKSREFILYGLFDRAASPSPSLRRWFNASILPYCCSIPLEVVDRICSNSACIPS